MIRSHLTRDRDVGRASHRHFDQGIYEETLFEALRRLVMAELRFGARVTSLTSSQARLETRVFGDLDTTEISGSAEEMAPIIQSIRLYQQHCSPSQVVATDLIEMLEALPHGTAADRGFQNLIMPFSVCEIGLHLCLLVPLGIASERELQLAAGMSIDDAFAVLELTREFPGMSFADVAIALSNQEGRS